MDKQNMSLQSNLMEQALKSDQNEKNIYIDEVIEKNDKVRMGKFILSMKKLKNIINEDLTIYLYEDAKLKISKIKSGQHQAMFQQFLQAVQQNYDRQYRLKQITLHYDDFYHVNLPSPVQIAHIQFHNLQVLNLSGHRISNIEALTFLLAPQLVCLELYNNLICSLQILNKADFKKLETITFYHNPLTRMEPFCRIHSKNLKNYEFDCDDFASPPLEDYRFLFKMQNIIPKNIILLSKHRIDQVKNQLIFKKLRKQGTYIMYQKPQIQMAPLRIRLS